MKYYVEIAYTEDGKGILLCQQFTSQSIASILAYLEIEHTGAVGVDGKMVSVSYQIHQSCRIELYPALKVDPIEKRKRLVEHRRKKTKS